MLSPRLSGLEIPLANPGREPGNGLSLHPHSETAARQPCTFGRVPPGGGLYTRLNASPWVFHQISLLFEFMESPPQTAYELTGWFPPVIGWTDEYLHPIFGHGGYLEPKPILKAFVKAEKWGVPVSAPCYLEFAQCEICGILTRGGRKNHINEDCCCFAPSCFTKKQQTSIASYSLFCRNPPELFQFELALQMTASLFPGSRPHLQMVPPTIVNIVEEEDQMAVAERLFPVDHPGQSSARAHSGKQGSRDRQTEPFDGVEADGQRAKEEPITPGVDVPRLPVPRLPAPRLSLRAELAILGYMSATDSLRDLSPEVVAGALEDPNLTDRQKETIFQKLQERTERSIKKALRDCQ